MVQLRDRLCFALESLLSLRVLSELAREYLDCDLAVEPRVARAKDFAHAARANVGADLVWTEAAASREFHRATDSLSYSDKGTVPAHRCKHEEGEKKPHG